MDLNDYGILPTDFVNRTYNEFKNICRFEHDHRRWEYALAIDVLMSNKSENILEVGGGGSLLIPLIYRSPVAMVATEVDPWDCSDELRKQEAQLELTESIRYFQKDFLDFELDEKFDAVVCTSVIEHVPEHKKFFLKLLDYVEQGGLLVLTTDFHPSSEPFSANHLRTYSERDMLDYIELAEGFTVYGEGYDYTYWGNYVYEYSFGSLVLKNE